MSTTPFWTILVDKDHCLGRFLKRSDAEHAAAQLATRLRCRPKLIRLHHDFTSLRKARSTR